MDLSSDRPAGDGGSLPAVGWGGIASSSGNSSSSSPAAAAAAAGGLGYPLIPGQNPAFGCPVSSGGPPLGAPLGYSPLQQQQQQLQQQQLQQQQGYQGWLGSSAPAGQLGPGMGTPVGAPGGPPGAPGAPDGGPLGPPCPRTMRLELQQLLSPEDRQTLQQIAARARASAAAATLGLGALALSAFKKRSFRYPIFGACVVGLTVGPPVGFAGYMALNYSKVQHMESKFREAQALFEARRRGFEAPVPGSFGAAAYPGGPMGAPQGWRPQDGAAAAAAGWGAQPPLGSSGAPPPDELLKE
ncbi:hypothetical protein, conserved [Eimeria tenella]|uniref:Transmembrane protein n=1 Tax=Eimeria tenella TaxID=5802 RepID=U6KS24_EIMTE|nr:hypothetical protein, conserved [Eimeria tenella]CDJ39164.1 hypothetical protein, conserved [Eimeria tenella]|eukprot:XP_013229919.1 hypothetical protein, conserved [Eimeria tenella]